AVIRWTRIWRNSSRLSARTKPPCWPLRIYESHVSQIHAHPPVFVRGRQPLERDGKVDSRHRGSAAGPWPPACLVVLERVSLARAALAKRRVAVPDLSGLAYLEAKARFRCRTHPLAGRVLVSPAAPRGFPVTAVGGDVSQHREQAFL